MTVQREGMPTWLDKYPYQEKAKGLDPDQVLFVDIGGGLGHQSLALREALPDDISNRIIVQDQAPVIAKAKASGVKMDNVEYSEHDFFSEQPIKGARMYYMRNIIHDWPDLNSKVIMQRIRDAMGPDSVLLIDDMVVPDTGAHWQATQLDMVMMASLASRERSRAHWEKLIAEAGLKINGIYEYTTSLNDSIIECVPA